MAREEHGESEMRGHPIAIERLKERIENLLLSADVEYGVRFDDNVSGGQFAYSWAAIWSEN
jgi:hypothetical protein